MRNAAMLCNSVFSPETDPHHHKRRKKWLRKYQVTSNYRFRPAKLHPHRRLDLHSVIPVVITVYADRSFSFITKTPPAAVLLKKAAGIQKASGEPNKTKVASVTKAQVREIAEKKMPDLNAASIEAAMSMIEGTARSMGITVTE